MYEIDPSRTDLAEEFRNSPEGPHSPELELIVNRLRIMPLAERHVLVCTKPGREWMLAKLPAMRGAKMELFEDRRFGDYKEAVWEIFKRRWKTLTGQDLM